MKKLGQVIKELRKRKGINQKQLAELVNTSQSYISQIETGYRTPSISVLRDIGESINVPHQILLFLSLTEDQVSESKRDAFKLVQPAINAMIKEYFLT